MKTTAKILIAPTQRMQTADKSVYVMGTHSSVVPTWVERVSDVDKYAQHVRQRSDALGKLEDKRKLCNGCVIL